MPGTEDKFYDAPELVRHAAPQPLRMPAASFSSAMAGRLVQRGSPFELTPHENGSGIRIFRHAPASLNAVYRRAAAAPERSFLILRDRSVRIGDLLLEAHGLALELLATGEPFARRRVAIALPSGPEWLAAFIAVTSIGATATLIAPTDSIERIESALSTTGCVALITDEALARHIQHSGTRMTLLVARRHSRDQRLVFDGVEIPAHLPLFDRPIEPDREALIAFTSGSTGQPKGIVSTHEAVIAGMMNMMLGSALAATRHGPTRSTADSRPQLPSSLLLAPFTHIAGYSHLLLMMWVSGKVAALPTWNRDDALDLIERERLRTISGVGPDRLRALLRSEPMRHGLTTVTGVGVHGAVLRPALLREIRERIPGAEPMSGYGLTETNGSICVAAGNEVLAQSCGPVVPSAQVRIVDDDNCDVPRGCAGEICIRGAMLFSSYCTSQGSFSPLQDGWFRTNDFGQMDADGNLFLTERRQDCVTLRGRAFSYATLERLSCECGEFDDAAAVTVGEGDHRRIIIAVVSQAADVESTARAVSCLYRNDELANSGARIVIVDSLPRTDSGKVDRQALRQQLETSLPNEEPHPSCSS